PYVQCESACERFRRSRLVIDNEITADCGDAWRRCDTEPAACVIDLMDRLVAEVAVPGVPDPMPVVMKAIARERLHRRRTGPQVVIDAGGNGLGRRTANRVAALEAQRPREI